MGGHLDTRRMLAVMRNVAGALAYMHQHGLTHNDIKPENIMLNQNEGEPIILVKLGDLGLARRTLDRSSDFSQYGMTVFCMVIDERFGTRKFQKETVDQLIDEVNKTVKARLRALSDTPDDTIMSLSKLPKQLRQIWGEKVNMAQLEEWPPLCGWTFHPLEST